MASENLDGAYWAKRWDNGKTQWRDKERSDAGTFERNAKLLLQELHARTGASSPKKADLRQAFANATVFVPMCGDTPALGFWAKQMEARVFGVEIVEDSLKRAIAEQFADRTADWQPADAHGVKRCELAPVAAGEAHVTLYCGDVMAVLTNPKEYLPEVDIVYDRAAMVALHPESQQPKYVDAMRHLLTVHHNEEKASRNALFAANGKRTRRVMLLTVVERGMGEASMSSPTAAKQQPMEGPPFHISEDDVMTAYVTVTGGTTRYVTPVWGDRAPLEDVNAPPFVEMTYVVTAQADDHPHPILDSATE